MNKEIIEMFNTMSKDDFTTDEEARDYIEKIFNGYNKRKRNGTLYNKEENIPQILIGAYFTYVKRLDINDIFGNFKRKYIYNENQLEEVHELKERQGLSKVYDYLQDLNDYSKINIYELLKIHKILYSIVECTEFGGQIRTSQAHIAGAPINLSAPENIIPELQNLYIDSISLARRGLVLSECYDPIRIIEYIDDCINLTCRIVKIHPFGDGNGRSSRALLNLYFKIANIPPIYIAKREKDEYQEAMAKAICDDEYNPDFSSINKFYYYKLCDSIIELDVSRQRESQYKK